MVCGNSADDFTGEEGQGFRYILNAMNAERILVAQECIGDGRWLLNKGIEYAKERVVFDRPIGQNQGIQFPLARAYAELEAADMICRRAATLFDAAKKCRTEANMAKLLASEAT
jgi:acyl-CoA dehydrogenase